MISKKKKLALVVAATAAVGATISLGFTGGSPAQADPKQYSAFIGFGSDTTQDVMNAHAGFNNGINYQPVQSSAASGYRQLASWDTFPAGSCITAKVGSPTILRPNGSTNGRRALSRAFGGGLWGNAACGNRVMSGLVDFARSSAGPATAGTALTYIPFGRDALSYGYVAPAGGLTPVTDLSSAEISALFSTGPDLIDGVVLIPCGIQTGSGTHQSWLTSIGVSDTGTALCNSLTPGAGDGTGRVQESNGPQLQAKAAALATASDDACDGEDGGAVVSCANAQVVVGYSASQFIARSNGVALPAVPATVKLGGIDGNPAVNGVAPTLTPNAGFYSNAIYGRDVYNVLATEVVEDLGNAGVQSMFVGANSALCSDAAEETTETFGFQAIGAACGSTSLTGPFVAN